jgi:hypothetical protein
MVVLFCVSFMLCVTKNPFMLSGIMVSVAGPLERHHNNTYNP